MVKLADRITNLQPPPGYWDAEKIERYREEGRAILNELGKTCV
jgi:(p)ppGpp synthase/HD superfamily hydrolase